MNPTTPTTQATFDAAYWASQPPVVQALQNIGDENARQTLGIQLATQGYKIDNTIMVWGGDPWATMMERESFGYTWIPSILQQPVSVVPGLVYPPYAPYDPLHPPAGSILVSTKLPDYPPFNPPAPSAPPPPPPADYVGAQLSADIYACLPGDHTPDGVKVTDSRGSFVKHIVPMLADGVFAAYYQKSS